MICRLESVLFALYPAGKVRKAKFLIGDVLGSPGDSLEIVIEGDKAGLWTDRATGDGGDIFDLIARHHQIDTQSDFPQVMKLARDLTGRTTVTPPKKHKKEALIDELGPATAKWDYFTAAGQLIACVYRYDPPGQRKEFRPWDAKRKKMAPPDPRPLYNQLGMVSTVWRAAIASTHPPLTSGTVTPGSPMRRAASSTCARARCARMTVLIG